MTGKIRDSNVCNATKIPTIKRMNDNCVKLISAGEKINDIETTVRELIENSIDAGATNIEVKLNKFGFESIEIEDNGTGIKEEDLKFIGERYHTSKITNYKKFQEELQTFGFRGEALACLCSIASLSVITKSADSPTGTRVTFNKNGSKGKTEPVARSIGTTIIVKNLFHSLPVRRKELEASAKRQYDKVVRAIYEHLLVRPEIKFTLCKGIKMKKEKDFTHGGTTQENVIISIFGIKTMESLVALNKTILTPEQSARLVDSTQISNQPNEQRKNININEISQQSEEQLNGNNNLKEEPLDSKMMGSQFYRRTSNSRYAKQIPDYKIHGYISKVGQGRYTTDCQFLFVNRKPCDLPRVSRLINQIYRNHSPNQHPFFCIFIEVQPWAVDFNVPRKRGVILSDETKLCEVLNDIFDTIFAPAAPSGVPCMDSCATVNLTCQEPKVLQTKKIRELSEEPNDDSRNISFYKKPRRESNELTSREANRLTQPSGVNIEDTEPHTEPTVESIRIPGGEPNAESKRESIDEFFKETPGEPTVVQIEESISKPIEAPSRQPSETPNLEPTGEPTPVFSGEPIEKNSVDPIPEHFIDSYLPKPIIEPQTSESASQETNKSHIDDLAVCLYDGIDNSNSSYETMDSYNDASIAELLSIDYFRCRLIQKTIIDDDLDVSVSIEFLEDLSEALSRERTQRLCVSDFKEYSFAIHPDFSRVSEEQLKINLSRQSFVNMDIVGQFNRGFIITRFNDHIFIIDQHASHERFNFEDQLDKCPLNEQPMVRPKPLLLTMIQENAVIDNIDEFTKRGFRFAIDENKLSGYRVQLSSISVCKGHGLDVHLDKGDVEELINVILNSPNVVKNYTLEKVKNLAATRACRKSVMIGEPLTRSQMHDIVSKMSGLQNPWICAHGRPTIRHLMDVQWMHRSVKRPKWIESI